MLFHLSCTLRPLCPDLGHSAECDHREELTARCYAVDAAEVCLSERKLHVTLPMYGTPPKALCELAWCQCLTSEADAPSMHGLTADVCMYVGGHTILAYTQLTSGGGCSGIIITTYVCVAGMSVGTFHCIVPVCYS